MTRKIMLLLCITWFAGEQASAQTTVSGLITSNTVWTLANSPYHVTGNILVNTGVTLTIEAGVTVKFDSLKALQVNGKLLARGTASSAITFTANKTAPAGGYWGYLFFGDSSADAVFDSVGNYTGGSILEYCIVEYVGGLIGSYGAVEITSAHPYINCCTIRNNNRTGIYARSLTASLKIAHCSIHDNTRSSSDGDGGGGIYAAGGTVTISNDTLSNNTSAYHGDGGGIFINTGMPVIRNNIFSNNIAAYEAGGVYLYNCTSATFSNNTLIGNIAGMGWGGIQTLYGTATISNNIFYKNSGAILIYYGSATITANSIIGSTSQINGNGGSGVFIRSAAATIAHNVIADNGGGGIQLGEYYTGMTVTMTNNSIIRNSALTASAVDYSISYAGSHTENFSWNTITGNTATDTGNTCTIRIAYLPLFNVNNIFNNTAAFEVFNINGNSSPNLNAKNNWWGTTSDAVIQGKIHDWFDDASLGIVDYSPYLSAPDTSVPVSPPIHVHKTSMVGGQVKITWSRNPEADVAGYHVYYGGFNGYSFAHLVDAGTDTVAVLSGVQLTDTFGVTAYDRIYSPANEQGSTIVNDNMTNGNESWYAYATAANGVLHGSNKICLNTLLRNSPNPVKTITTISFSLVSRSKVTLNIYDLAGRVVASLINNKFLSSGSHLQLWNVSGIPAGIYYYRLKTDNGTETKKLILQR